MWDFPVFPFRRRGDQDDGGYNPAQVWTGLGNSLRLRAGPRLQVSTFSITS